MVQSKKDQNEENKEGEAQISRRKSERREVKTKKIFDNSFKPRIIKKIDKRLRKKVTQTCKDCGTQFVNNEERFIEHLRNLLCPNYRLTKDAAGKDLWVCRIKDDQGKSCDMSYNCRDSIKTHLMRKHKKGMLLKTNRKIKKQTEAKKVANSQQPVISNVSSSRSPSLVLPSVPIKEKQNVPIVLIPTELQEQRQNAQTIPSIPSHDHLEDEFCDQHIVDIQDNDENTPSEKGDADSLMLETEEIHELLVSEDTGMQKKKESYKKRKSMKGHLLRQQDKGMLKKTVVTRTKKKTKAKKGSSCLQGQEAQTTLPAILSVPPKDHSEDQKGDQQIVDIQDNDDNTPSENEAKDSLMSDEEKSPKLVYSKDIDMLEMKVDEVENNKEIETKHKVRKRKIFDNSFEPRKKRDKRLKKKVTQTCKDCNAKFVNAEEKYVEHLRSQLCPNYQITKDEEGRNLLVCRVKDDQGKSCDRAYNNRNGIKQHLMRKHNKGMLKKTDWKVKKNTEAKNVGEKDKLENMKEDHVNIDNGSPNKTQGPEIVFQNATTPQTTSFLPQPGGGSTTIRILTPPLPLQSISKAPIKVIPLRALSSNVVPLNTLQTAAFVLQGQNSTRNTQQSLISNSSNLEQPSVKLPTVPMNSIQGQQKTANTPVLLFPVGFQRQKQNVKILPKKPEDCKEYQIGDQNIVDIQDNNVNELSEHITEDPLRLEIGENSEDTEMQEIKEEEIEIKQEPIIP